ncbi:hypothetical protein COZ84_03590 [Candidatus Kuenenbacteria bacterium CG_4_8_14_3_um_filter_39_15]|uniref:Nudix hydrolase domain-containing protein n=4 Tax=Candidatus Kueneniibacteriota TaxID=1752740 RepID=A0A2M7IKU5_9BACT|nr:NUDIX hydrolase [Candidatus Kuenenbacteria bacterium]OIP56922.1 MAG: hypothetical protein AUK13_00140 [Candidatus Kuenenbacteria bacterium CG2_30_39_24]PIP75662.1 MAG: hypothetical protein COW86_02525 [Candidatus Kuenenbacteria bacterium CG22_combo_CG10-13_8_21_14_all_39_9]PIR81129.1 MAG: hypothetical protein COU24_00275 [Candidatus Kuenenbacteria bacterium CG10_big_fil_rev_8_21_14_0_10_39_14]PIW95424.1 MAG: hypothetical protein COZ84_03590 [Candidatus Kuenenbacteria bacterium CG_4_8_14_3_um
MTTEIKTPISVVTAIIERKNRSGETLVYMQERWKPRVSPDYSGLWELPCGGIEPYENIFDALKREVKEECGLIITSIGSNRQNMVYNPRHNDKSYFFQPFICHGVTETRNGLPWIGFAFICKVEGKVNINKKEARKPIWFTIDALRDLVTKEPDKIFPLHLPVLDYYLKFAKL